MNSVRQYRPAYFSGFENATVDFSTTAELLAIPFVDNFKRETFHQFSKSDDKLMAEYQGGGEWWVVGIIADPKSVDLPEWDYSLASEARKLRTDLQQNCQ